MQPDNKPPYQKENSRKDMDDRECLQDISLWFNFSHSQQWQEAKPLSQLQAHR